MLLPAHAHAVNPAPTTTTQQQLFYDVPASHPFFTEVNWVARMGVAKGDPGQVFGASRSVSRGAMAAFLYRFSGETYTPPARAVH
jgi:hypothetical protein